MCTNPRGTIFTLTDTQTSMQVYEAPVSDLCILHAQVETANKGELLVTLPPFLQVERRINKTKVDEETYGAFSISRMS